MPYRKHIEDYLEVSYICQVFGLADMSGFGYFTSLYLAKQGLNQLRQAEYLRVRSTGPGHV